MIENLPLSFPYRSGSWRKITITLIFGAFSLVVIGLIWSLPPVRLARWLFPGGILVVEPFRIHVAAEVLDDLRVRLRHARWPDQVPGIGWNQGTELDWVRHLVSYWADEFDWSALRIRG